MIKYDILNNQRVQNLKRKSVKYYWSGGQQKYNLRRFISVARLYDFRRFVTLGRKHLEKLYLLVKLEASYNNNRVFKMPAEDSEQGDMQLKQSEKLSLPSTTASLASCYSDFFFIGNENSKNNLVSIQLDHEKLLYEHKNQIHVLDLFMTVIEESTYLRNSKTVFAIKLTKSQTTLLLSTFDKNSFLQLYLQLAKCCVLTNFQKHYRVGKQLGNGTFGVVYDGFNRISNENVALKVISKQKINQTQQGLNMLHNEIQILQSLRNYKISPLISTYETADCFILVLEKGTGGNLFEYIQANAQNYGEKMIKSIFKQLLQILSILHHVGIIHRDIKPENVICKGSENPSIFLCDYSISVHKDELNPEQNDTMAGTIGYVAPEIINEQGFDQKSDIFSVGCMFFYLFTGKKLFEAKSFSELQSMNEDSRYITKRLEKLKHLNFEVRDLLQKLLSFDPQGRPSANEALKHPYFKGSQIFLPNLGYLDETLGKFLQMKISKFWK